MHQAGYSSIKQNGLAGGLNTVGIIGTIISAHIVDRLGRRVCLMGGAAVLFAVNIIVCVYFTKLRPLSLIGYQAGAVYEGSLHDPSKAAQYAPAAITMLFLFNIGLVDRIKYLACPLATDLTSFNSYAATWGTVAFLVPTEIFPSDLRAQGNGFGITGWAIGVGMTTLVNPIMFDAMKVRSSHSGCR